MRNYLLIFACVIALPAAGQAQRYSIAGANPYVQRKDWNGLLAYTKAWTQADPNDPMAWYYLGQTYGIGFNQPANAANAFRRAVSLKPQWPEAWHALAFTCDQSKQYKDAVAAARRAIAETPDKPNYWNTLAATYSHMEDWNDELQTLHEEEQHMARATSFDWFNLGNAYSNAGHYQEALKAYNQSLQMAPNYGPAWNNLGVVEAALGQTAKALADYQRASQLGNSTGTGNYSSLQQQLAATRAAASARASGPRPFTPACYQSLSPNCANDPSSLVYVRNHSSPPDPSGVGYHPQ
jgi:tetratricopeptide (TPR) repeat protein